MCIKSLVYIFQTLNIIVKRCLVKNITFWFTQRGVDDHGSMSFVLKGGKTQINFSWQSMKVGLPLSSTTFDSPKGNGFRIGSGGGRANRASHRREEGGEIRNHLWSELPRVAQGSS